MAHLELGTLRGIIVHAGTADFLPEIVSCTDAGDILNNEAAPFEDTTKLYVWVGTVDSMHDPFD
jgi:hypothetical protein